MKNINFKIDINVQTHYNKKNKSFIIVETFDNFEFSIRYGTLSSTKFIGNIVAKTDDELNKKIIETLRKNMI